MYKIDKPPFGYKLTFEGFIKDEEMTQWVEDSKKALIGAPKEFGVFVDMRSLKALSPSTKEVMANGQRLYKEKGMIRSVVIVDKAVTKMQFQRIAKETGIDQWERYIDATSNPDWEQAGIDWLKSAKEPG